MLRSALHNEGLRFRIHRKDLPGNPDIVFPKQRLAIFVHGCFWHYHQNCKEGKIPNSNSKFWKEKLTKNIARDRKNIKLIEQNGWYPLVIWECEIEKRIDVIIEKIIRTLKKGNAPQ